MNQDREMEACWKACGFYRRMSLEVFHVRALDMYGNESVAWGAWQASAARFEGVKERLEKARRSPSFADMAVQIDDHNPQGDALKNLNVMIVRHCPICR